MSIDNRITRNKHQLAASGTRIEQSRMEIINAPASDELERAAALSDQLAHEIRRTRHLRLQQVRLDLEAAEELVQLLRDSLRTAEQIKGNVRS